MRIKTFACTLELPQADRIRGALVAVEVALALALVVVGGQLLASFAALLRTDPGFDAKRVTAFIVLPDAVRYPTPEKWEAFYRRVLDSVRVLPGVDSAGTDDAFRLAARILADW